MLVNAQSHLYVDTRQTMCVTKHNNADQTFYFLCVFGFLTQNQEKIDQKLESIQNKKQTNRNH